MKKIICFILFTIVIIGCRSSIDIINENDIESNLIVKDTKVIEGIAYVLDQVTEERNDFLFLIDYRMTSDSTYYYRITPTVRKQFRIPKPGLSNKYQGYFMYENVLVVVWGERSPTFSRKKGVPNDKLFSQIVEVNKKKSTKRVLVRGKGDEGLLDDFFKNPEKYSERNYEIIGYDFKAINEKLFLMEKNYTSTIRMIEHNLMLYEEENNINTKPIQIYPRLR